MAVLRRQLQIVVIIIIIAMFGIDIGHLKQNRRVVIYPMTIKELESAKLKEIIANDACEEMKVDFVRSKSDSKEYTG